MNTNQTLEQEAWRKKTYSELERCVKEKTLELSQANQELQEFVSRTAHDLQEPLHIIEGFTESLREQCSKNLDENSLFLLGRIQNASHRMSQLIQDLLRYARVSTHQKPFEWVDLNALIKEILVELDLRIQEAQAVIKCEELPSIYGDKLQIHHLFQNLIANALKFRKKESCLEVTLKSKVLPDDFVEILVEDNGIGFEQEYSQKIFEPYQRLHSRSEYEGSGLGLAICQKIVTRHKGKMFAKGVLNQGATFIFSLPTKA